MSPDDFDQLLSQELDRRRAANLFRARRVLNVVDAVHVERGGRRLVNFASNNYLGLTHHPRVRDAMTRAIASAGAGAGAAGLITGYTDFHERAEADLASWKGTGAAVLLPSGFQANLAAVATIAAVAEGGAGEETAPVRFLLDKLAHASLIDAVRATGRPFRVFPHNGLVKLRRLLDDVPAGQLQVVVTESIFSMDGDAADLAGLAALKRERPFLLLVDEAHGSGVYGAAGSGYAGEAGLRDAVDVTIVTLSKALGLAGGAVCASRRFCDALVNVGRAYVYSTSVPPAVAAGASAAIRVMRDEPHRQARVRALANRVRGQFRDAGVDLPAGDSPIVPILLGDEAAALNAAAELEDGGLLALAIRPPTVPPGTSRLRATLSCEHSDDEVERLVRAVCSVVVR